MGQTNETSASNFAVRNEEIVRIDWRGIEPYTWGVRVLYWRKRAIFPREFTLERAYPMWLIHDMLAAIRKLIHD